VEAFRTVVVVILVIGAISGVIMLAASIITTRRSPDDPLTRFTSGWLGAQGLIQVVVCCAGLSAGLTELVQSSGWAVAAAVGLNALTQPVLLLMCWVGFRKLALGLSGRVAYAWREVTPEELEGVTPADRQVLHWYCVMQGAVILPMGLAMSGGCALPLLVLAFA
jgi:hypothetical protein